MRRTPWVGLALLAACSVDLSRPRAWACRSSSECAGGWVCGLEGSCVDPASPGVRPCVDSSLCATALGWRCGLDGRCYDRTDAGAIACSRDAGVLGNAGGDCAPGWQCGLEGSCHREGDARAWLCVADSDCAGGWRCSLDGRCVDSAADELVRPTHHLQTGPQLNPVLLADATPAAFSATCDSSGIPHAMVATTAGVARVALLDRMGVIVLDGGVSVEPDDRLALTLEAGNSGRGALLVGGPARGLRRYSWSAGTMALSAAPELVVPGTQGLLRFVAEQNGRAVAVLDGGSALAITPTTTAPTVADADTFVFLDVAVASGPSATHVWAATSEGLRTAEVPDLPMAFNQKWYGVGGAAVSGKCSGAPPSLGRTIQVRFAGGRHLAFVTERTDVLGPGRSYWAGLIDVSADGGTCSDEPVLTCAPCTGAHDTLEDFAPLAGDSPRLWTQCLDGAGLRTHSVLSAPTATSGCTRTDLDGFPQAFDSFGDPAETELAPNPAPVQQFARAGIEGRAWAGTTAESSQPLFLDQLPAATVVMADGGLLFAVGPWLGRASAHGIGMDRLPLANTNLVAGVTWAPSWVVTDFGEIYDAADPTSLDPPLQGILLTSSHRGPYRSTLAQEGDGGVQLVVTAFDALYAAALPDASEPAPFLPQRVLVFGGSPVYSLAAARPSSGGAAVYAVTTAGVFRVESTGGTRWRSTEVPLPPVEYLATWTEGGRSRVGARDGTVYALPSRVRLGGALPGYEALDFAQLCGTVFALGVQVDQLALFRLEPGAGGAVWTLESELQLAPGADARLLSVGSQLLVATAFGGVMATTVAGCAGATP